MFVVWTIFYLTAHHFDLRINSKPTLCLTRDSLYRFIDSPFLMEKSFLGID
nr:MAG TPA_asm: hypothetical protein [Caudoviricetes sp.]